jgi:hypothetical protein
MHRSVGQQASRAVYSYHIQKMGKEHRSRGEIDLVILTLAFKPMQITFYKLLLGVGAGFSTHSERLGVPGSGGNIAILLLLLLRVCLLLSLSAFLLLLLLLVALPTGGQALVEGVGV